MKIYNRLKPQVLVWLATVYSSWRSVYKTPEGKVFKWRLCTIRGAKVRRPGQALSGKSEESWEQRGDMTWHLLLKPTPVGGTGVWLWCPPRSLAARHMGQQWSGLCQVKSPHHRTCSDRGWVAICQGMRIKEMDSLMVWHQFHFFQTS